jgi:serine phosphatase RsbU (regulator of sigma subunit)
MQPNRVRILLVEDDRDDVWIMRNLLADRWEGPMDLIHVERLADALERILWGDVDVALLDLTLPDSRGLETFLRMFAGTGDVPIVVLTGLNDEETAVKAVQAGAQDYLVKGQVDDHLLVRSIRYAIERSRRHQVERQLRATSAEFEAAQEIQRRLFPAQPPCVPGFDIAGALYPAAATAGDYFDFISMQNGNLGIVVGDVSSHGMGPALVMAETRACLRALAQAYNDVSEILTRANEVLTTDSDEFHFVTLAFARLEPDSRALVYASAGHRAYLLGADGSITRLESTSPPLAIDSRWEVPEAPRVALKPGQMVAFFTDGVSEAESPQRERFGADRALRLIADSRDRAATEIVTRLYNEVSEFIRPGRQSDDITVVVVKVQA